MTHKEIREKFLKFFEGKGHTIIPSSSLVPENDPSVLFTTAGMQQFKPYYLKAKNALDDFGSTNTTSVQKCVRTSDIEEVGDETHLTFFEMLGNFSFGGYFKEESIKYAHEFITKEMGLSIDYVTVFEGDDKVPADLESEKIWKEIDPSIEVKKFGKEDNFWGPTGVEGPCGPTTEIYVDDVEIWNVVFNEYYCKQDGSLLPLTQKGVDTGMGLERLAVAVQKKSNVFETDLFTLILNKIKELAPSVDNRSLRIIADHIRTAVFMITDGVVPSNTGHGYILRRLLRRAIFKLYGVKHATSETGFIPMAVFVHVVADLYKDQYPDIKKMIQDIEMKITDEESKFRATVEFGMKQFEKLSSSDISGKDAFILFSTYGFPLELTLELALEKNISVDVDGFNKEMQKHQELSREGSEQKFKGGLADTDEQSVKYHTATHLLQQALRDVLGEVEQKGSNITSERLRFDFSHNQKLTDEEKKKVEDLVNEKIGDALVVSCEEMSVDEARERGALGIFGEKYGEKVKVYSIGNFSKEICGGPHVENTSELGKFKIKKEESVSAGVRRIKAVLE